MVGGVTQTTSGVGSNSIGIKLSLTQLARDLLDVGKLSTILEECAAFGEQRAQGYCPVDTGRLRDSIGHETRGMKAVIYATEDYAEPVENGHVTRGGSFVAPRPFLAPASEDAFDLLAKRIQRHAETVSRK